MQTHHDMFQQTQSATRRAARADLDLYVNKIIGDEPHLARVRDISADGLYLYRLIEPQTGTRGNVGLELMLPNSDEVIWAVGEIVRYEDGQNSDGVGIRFLRIAERDRRLIEEYVESRQAA